MKNAENEEDYSGLLPSPSPESVAYREWQQAREARVRERAERFSEMYLPTLRAAMDLAVQNNEQEKDS